MCSEHTPVTLQCSRSNLQKSVTAKRSRDFDSCVDSESTHCSFYVRNESQTNVRKVVSFQIFFLTTKLLCLITKKRKEKNKSIILTRIHHEPWQFSHSPSASHFIIHILTSLILHSLPKQMKRQPVDSPLPVLALPPCCLRAYWCVVRGDVSSIDALWMTNKSLES